MTNSSPYITSLSTVSPPGTFTEIFMQVLFGFPSPTGAMQVPRRIKQSTLKHLHGGLLCAQ